MGKSKELFMEMRQRELEENVHHYDAQERQIFPERETDSVHQLPENTNGKEVNKKN